MKKQKLFTPKQNNSSFLTLLSISLIRIGTFTLLNFPALFEGVLIKEFNVTTLDISYLYSVMAIPNIFCNLAGSLIINSIGLGIPAILFTSMPFIFTIFSYMGYVNKNFNYLIVGRLFYGFGFDNTMLVQTVAAEKYFAGGNLTAILAMNRTMSNFAAFFMVYFQPILFIETRSLDLSLFVYGLIAFMSVLGAIYLAFREVMKERKKNGIFIEEKKNLRKFKFKDFKRISGLSWLIFFAGAVFVQGFNQFNYFGVDFFSQRTGLTLLEARSVMTITPIMSMILIPIFSVWVWKYGRKGMVLLLGTTLLCLGYGYMLTLPDKAEMYQAYIGMIVISLYWCVYCSVFWSSFIITLPEQATGIMVGLSFSLQNLVSTVMSPIFGMVNEGRDPASYQVSMWIMFGFSLFLLVFCVLIVYFDFKTGKQIHYCERDKIVKKRRETMTDQFEEEMTLLKGTIMNSET